MEEVRTGALDNDQQGARVRFETWQTLDHSGETLANVPPAAPSGAVSEPLNYPPMQGMEYYSNQIVPEEAVRP